MDELFLYGINYNEGDGDGGAGGGGGSDNGGNGRHTQQHRDLSFYEEELERARREAAGMRAEARAADAAKRDLETKLDQAQADLATAQARVTELEGEITPLKQQIEQVSAQRREAALARIPENHRERYSADGVSIDEIERAAETFAAMGTSAAGTSAGSDGTPPPTGEVNLADKPASELTPGELLSLKASDPEAYTRKLRESVRSTASKGIFG